MLTYKHRLDYDYTIPKTHWLGKDWNWPGWWPISSDYRDIINRNIGRQMTLHTDNVASGIWIYLSCPKQHDACSPGTIAASADANRIFWKNHYTVFCPLFFNKDSFSKSLDNVRNNVNEQMIMDNYWGNQGYTFFHETYHYGGSVSDPRTGDDCYQAEACWEMAADKYRGTGKSLSLIGIPIRRFSGSCIYSFSKLTLDCDRLGIQNCRFLHSRGHGYLRATVLQNRAATCASKIHHCFNRE